MPWVCMHTWTDKQFRCACVGCIVGILACGAAVLSLMSWLDEVQKVKLVCLRLCTAVETSTDSRTSTSCTLIYTCTLITSECSLQDLGSCIPGVRASPLWAQSTAAQCLRTELPKGNIWCSTSSAGPPTEALWINHMKTWCPRY